MADYDLTNVRRWPAECQGATTRHGEMVQCEKRAVAVRIDHSEGDSDPVPFPVCKHHTAGDCLPLTDLFGNDKAMLDELEKLRRLQAKVEQLRAERNELAEQVTRVREMAKTLYGDASTSGFTDEERAMLRYACERFTAALRGTS